MLHFLFRMSIWEPKKPRSDQWAFWARPGLPLALPRNHVKTQEKCAGRASAATSAIASAATEPRENSRRVRFQSFRRHLLGKLNENQRKSISRQDVKKVLQFAFRMSILEPKKPRSDQWAFWERKSALPWPLLR